MPNFSQKQFTEKYISMKAGGQILAEIIYWLKSKCHPGVSAIELDQLAFAEIKKRNAEPAFFKYQGFPNSLIVCLNEEVVHGIPHEKKIIKSGDLVTLDLGLTYAGYITDMAISFVVGQPKNQAPALIKATQEALAKAIAIIKPGITIGDIGHTIEQVADSYFFFVIHDCAGHGVGRQVHESPIIPNYGQAGKGVKLQEGMTVAIEPIFSENTEKTDTLLDGWTLVTDDGSLAAQSEHTIMVTADGCEVLTASNNSSGDTSF